MNCPRLDEQIGIADEVFRGDARTRQDAQTDRADVAPQHAPPGPHSLYVICHACGHHMTFNVDEWPDELLVPSFGPHIECTRCGRIGRSCGACPERDLRSNNSSVMRGSSARNVLLRIIGGSRTHLDANEFGRVCCGDHTCHGGRQFVRQPKGANRQRALHNIGEVKRLGPDLLSIIGSWRDTLPAPISATAPPSGSCLHCPMTTGRRIRPGSIVAHAAHAPCSVFCNA